METRRERIMRVQPWLRSTGAKTPLGREICAANSLKHGLSSRNALLRAVARHEQRWQLLEPEIQDFIRRLKPFVLANHPIPLLFERVIDFLGIDRETLFQQIRDEHQS